MKQQLLALAAIFLSVLLFLIGNGLLNTLTPVRAHLELFSDLSIGVMGSAYFAGFLTGCFSGPRLLARVGHSRTFSIAAGLAAAAALLQPLVVDQIVWAGLRAMVGFSAANLFVTIESWLNDRASNETRGRIFSTYMTINYSGLIVGQALFVTGDAMSFMLFNLSAMFYAVCLIPMGLTRLPQPRAASVPRLRPVKLFRIAPVGVMACITVGLTNGAMWTLGPVYALAHGMDNVMISAFMCAFVLGGALVQIPIGRLSDGLDRRIVITGVCLASAATGLSLALFGGGHPALTLLLVAIFGVAALPLYALSIAHTNDRIPREDFVEASATLLLVNGAASTAGPLIASLVTASAGSHALFYYTGAIHLAMAIFALIRMRMVEPAGDIYRDRFEPMPQQASPAMLELDPRSPDQDSSARS